MSWYRFVVNTIIAVPLTVLILLALTLIGAASNGLNDASRLLSMTPLLVITGGICAWGLSIRNKLIAFKREGYTQLIAYSILLAVIGAVFLTFVLGPAIMMNIAEKYISRGEFDPSAFFIVLALCAIAPILNGLYFRKRRHLFVN